MSVLPVVEHGEEVVEGDAVALLAAAVARQVLVEHAADFAASCIHAHLDERRLDISAPEELFLPAAHAARGGDEGGGGKWRVWFCVEMGVVCIMGKLGKMWRGIVGSVLRSACKTWMDDGGLRNGEDGWRRWRWRNNREKRRRGGRSASRVSRGNNSRLASLAFWIVARARHTAFPAKFQVGTGSRNVFLPDAAKIRGGEGRRRLVKTSRNGLLRSERFVGKISVDNSRALNARAPSFPALFSPHMPT